MILVFGHFDREDIYNTLLEIYQNYSENDKDVNFITDIFKTKLGPNHVECFSNLLYNCVPTNPLITYIDFSTK